MRRVSCSLWVRSEGLCGGCRKSHASLYFLEVGRKIILFAGYKILIHSTCVHERKHNIGTVREQSGRTNTGRLTNGKKSGASDDYSEGVRWKERTANERSVLRGV